MPSNQECETGVNTPLSFNKDLSELVQVLKPLNGEKNFTSKLVSKVHFKAGQIIYPLKGLTLAKKRYTTVQIGENNHIELNSDLVYMNHSCDPSVNVDTDNRFVIAMKDIAPGAELTFFYPTTEWDMDQPFQCWCSHPKCIKEVQGAKYLPKHVFEENKYIFNSHILKLKASE
ncbi:hypothetical protein ROZALSC1DRAFT_28796 [Rozella allomycis CSF55]|uniref:SET domain-containing protein n=1 Tax=Rozella allomycis (strain CSF55) TaxID=988480 RepID=A0A4P9YL61_ROZAC|nr:hypothetical protein ROZALSC1DRAFT_28796 [Rozella allomycis CSF55]